MYAQACTDLNSPDHTSWPQHTYLHCLLARDNIKHQVRACELAQRRLPPLHDTMHDTPAPPSTLPPPSAVHRAQGPIIVTQEHCHHCSSQLPYACLMQGRPSCGCSSRGIVAQRLESIRNTHMYRHVQIDTWAQAHTARRGVSSTEVGSTTLHACRGVSTNVGSAAM